MGYLALYADGDLSDGAEFVWMGSVGLIRTLTLSQSLINLQRITKMPHLSLTTTTIILHRMHLHLRPNHLTRPIRLPPPPLLHFLKQILPEDSSRILPPGLILIKRIRMLSLHANR